jgi:hypothetical protein
MADDFGPTAADLRPLLRRGLPAAPEVIAGRLLELAGVGARAEDGDRDNRVAAFNSLLRQLARRMPDQSLSRAARALLGDDRAGAGRTLTERRAEAARLLGRDPDHFRKHIEPRILSELAAALADDSARMRATRAAPPGLVPVIRAPAGLPQDLWAWEAVEHEEQISRLWAAVYALRAELLACERLASFDPLGATMRDAADAALWRLGQMHAAVAAYRCAYGARLLHGGIAPEALISLAGWSQPLDPSEADLAREVADGAGSRDAFITVLTAAEPGRRLRGWWLAAVSSQRPAAAADRGSAA